MANVPFFFDGERKVFVSSAANRTDALAVENPGAHYQEIGGNLYESNGSAWNPISISGAGLVTNGLNGPWIAQPDWVLSAVAGYINGGSLTNPAQGIRVTFKKGAASADVGLLLCLDPDTDAIRDDFLTVTNAAPRINIPISDVPVEIKFSDAVNKIGTKAYGTTLTSAFACVEILL